MNDDDGEPLKIPLLTVQKKKQQTEEKKQNRKNENFSTFTRDKHLL